MKIYSDNAVTTDYVDAVDVKQTLQIKRLTGWLIFSGVANLVVTLTLFFIKK
jgi:hypothetical protein